MLEIKKASASVGGRRLFENVSLVAADSSLTCIVGSHGQGKTTLLNAIMGLHPLDEGHVSIDGELLSAASAQEFRRQLISFVPQTMTTDEGTVGELAQTLFAIEANKGKAFPRTLLDEEWQRLGLAADIYDRRLSQLSPSECHRALLGIVCLQNKPILLVDDPLTGHDAETASLVAAYLADRARRGQTVVATGSLSQTLSKGEGVMPLVKNIEL